MGPRDCGSVSDPGQQNRTDAGPWLDPLGLGLLGALVGLACSPSYVGLGQLATMARPRCVVTLLACIVLLHPDAFAIGRGHSEPLGALFGGVMLLIVPSGVVRTHPIGKTSHRAAMLAIIVGQHQHRGRRRPPAVKGLNPQGRGLAMNLIGWCDPIGFREWKASDATRRCCRQFVLAMVFGLVVAGLLGVGSVSEARGGWWWWSFLPFAVFDVLGLYLLVGAGSASSERTPWPSTRPRAPWNCSGTLWACFVYVAAQAVEAKRDLAWRKTMVVLGNNGRHGMVLLPAAVWTWSSGRCPLPTERLHRAFVLLLPCCSPPHTVRRCGPTTREAALSHPRGRRCLLIHDPTLRCTGCTSCTPSFPSKVRTVLSVTGEHPMRLGGRAAQRDRAAHRGDLSSVAVGLVIAPNPHVTPRAGSRQRSRGAGTTARHVARSLPRRTPKGRPRGPTAPMWGEASPWPPFLRLPDIGEGVVGEVVEWFVAVGDAIVEDQPCSVTDKATVEIGRR